MNEISTEMMKEIIMKEMVKEIRTEIIMKEMIKEIIMKEMIKSTTITSPSTNQLHQSQLHHQLAYQRTTNHL